jgi:hypothetical protein
MKRRVLIEGILLLAFSLVAMSEALRLIISKDPLVLYDPLGPGYYILVLSFGLFVAAIVHVAVNYKKSAQSQKTTEPGSGARVLFSVGAMILYILLVRIVSYPVATLIFCLLQFWIAGVRSWRTNTILSVVFTAVCYFIFIKLCGIVFPEGLLF